MLFSMILLKSMESLARQQTNSLGYIKFMEQEI